MSYDAGALIFKIQTAGAQVFQSDMAAVDQAVEKAGKSSADATPKVERVGTAVDATGKKAKDAKAPLDEQAKSTKKIGDESDDAAKKQQKQATSSAEQAASARELSAALLITGAAVTAVVALSVAKYAEFDQAMSQTQAATMATAEEQRSLADAALDAGADTAYSATEAANAQEELAKAGLSVSDIIGGSLNGALALAAAGQLEVARSAEIMATTLKQYSLPAGEAAHVSDLLAAGAGKAMGSVEDLANGLKFVGPVAASMGVSLEETVGVLALFADQGIIGEQAGTSFRGMLSSLTSPSQIASKTLADYNVQLFDGNGKMKSAAAIAGELNTAFNGLSDAERSAALGRIFGNEQITAATVLMRAGTAGVEDYTAAVNDSGYAAEQARLKQDNLAGDVEKLGGAFDTALIRTGSGANDILRTMTQTATALVDVYGDMPEPLHQIALGGGVALGAITLLAGAAVSGRAKFLELRDAFDNTSTSMKRTALVGAGAGLALTGILTVVSILAVKQGEMSAATSEYADTLDDATGAMTEYTRELIAKRLADSGAFEGARQAGIGQKELTDALYRGGDAYDAVMQKLRAAHDASGGFNFVIGNTINAVKDNNTFLADAKIKHDDLKAATEGSTDATGAGAEVTETAAEAYVNASKGADGLESQLRELMDAILEANGVGQDAISANVAYQDALREVDEQIAKVREGAEGYSATLDISTEAGSRNIEMLNGLAQDAQKAAKAQFDLDGDTAKYRATLEGSRQALIDRARDLGATEEKAGALADQIFRIPPDTEWEIIAKTAEASRRAQEFIDLLNRIPATKPVAISATLGGLGSMINQADGGKVEFFAHGGRHGENHLAQFARAGTYRVWAEDETGGEWYLPNSPAKRDRSVAIAKQMAAEWGYDMIPHSAQAAAPLVARAAPASLPDTITLVDASGALLGRMRVVAQNEISAAQQESGRRLSSGESSR